MSKGDVRGSADVHRTESAHDTVARLRAEVHDLEGQLGRARVLLDAARQDAQTVRAENREWAEAFAGIRAVLDDWVSDAGKLPGVLAERLGYCARLSETPGWAPCDRVAGHRGPCTHPLIPPPLPSGTPE